ncbi:MAG: hypothetical protein AAF668_07580 [Pseudomonadota bacterium]
MSEDIAEIRNEIESLRQRNRQNPDPDVELSLRKLRLAAGDFMVRSAKDTNLPMTSVPDVFSNCKGLPGIPANDFNAETLASSVLHYGRRDLLDSVDN